jgi:hypothetical protein
MILQQSYLHLFSYGLVLGILFVALADAFLIRHLQAALRKEGGWLREAEISAGAPETMLHPVASSLCKLAGSPRDGPALRRYAELAEAALFVPLRARMTLTRDLSTLMGLIATLLALVAAASDFARNGQPELLVGSVGTGCIATCVAAIGCGIALWNLSRLTRLRLETACEAAAVLEHMLAARDARASEPGEQVTIRFKEAQNQAKRGRIHAAL